MHVIFDKQYQSFYSLLTYLYNDISCSLKKTTVEIISTLFSSAIYVNENIIIHKNVFKSINIHENVYAYSNKTICLWRMLIQVE